MSEDTQAIELSLEQANASIDYMNTFLRLVENADFNKIITEGYFETEAARLVMLKGEPSMQGDESQVAILKAIDGIGAVRQYLRTIIHTGNMAKKAKEDDEAALDDDNQEEG